MNSPYLQVILPTDTSISESTPFTVPFVLDTSANLCVDASNLWSNTGYSFTPSANGFYLLYVSTWFSYTSTTAVTLQTTVQLVSNTDVNLSIDSNCIQTAADTTITYEYTMSHSKILYLTTNDQVHVVVTSNQDNVIVGTNRTSGVSGQGTYLYILKISA
jgi:hypothetical protein